MYIKYDKRPSPTTSLHGTYGQLQLLTSNHTALEIEARSSRGVRGSRTRLAAVGRCQKRLTRCLCELQVASHQHKTIRKRTKYFVSRAVYSTMATSSDKNGFYETFADPSPGERFKLLSWPIRKRAYGVITFPWNVESYWAQTRANKPWGAKVCVLLQHVSVFWYNTNVSLESVVEQKHAGVSRKCTRFLGNVVEQKEFDIKLGFSQLQKCPA